MTILHREDGFKLSTPAHWGWKSWIFHWHPDEEVWLSCGCYRWGKCGRCHEKIPDEIYGLWKLHNWDYIRLMR